MKISWLSIENLNSATKFGSLSAGLTENRFTPNSLTGFRVLEVRRSNVTAEYIERTEFIEHLIDPFGATTEIPRVRYDITNFRVYSTFPELELINPPRNTANLISSLSRLLQFSSSIERPRVALTEWLSDLETELGDIDVYNMIFTDIRVGSVTEGQLSVKGTTNVRRETKLFLGERSGVLSKVGFAARIKDDLVRLEINAASRATVDGGNSEQLLKILRKSLAKAFSRNPGAQ